MSTTAFGTNSDLTVKLWSQRTYYDFETDQQLVGELIKCGALKLQDELAKSAGDRVRMTFANRLVTPGLVGMESSVGNEQPIVYSSDDLFVNQLRVVVQIPAAYTIDAQRVLMDLPEDSYRLTSQWMQVRGSLGILNQAAGNTANTLTWDGQNYVGNTRQSLTGLNTAVAPSTTSGCVRIFRPNGWTTDEQVAADPTATAKLSDIYAMETIATTYRPYLPPLEEGTDVIKFRYIVHNQCWTDLANDTSGPWQYRDIQQSMIKSGRGEGELQSSFPFSNTQVMKTDKIPNGVNSSTSNAVANTRRNVFMGRNAAGIAYGRGYQDVEGVVRGFRIMTDLVNVGMLQNIAMMGVWGISKFKFADTTTNGTYGVNDNGVIVCTNYSAI